MSERSDQEAHGSGVTAARPLPVRLLVRFAAVALLALAAWIPFIAGDRLPLWIIRLGDLVDVEGEHAARVTGALFAGLALLTLLSRRSPDRSALIGGILLSFCGIATLAGSAAVARPTIIGGAAALLAGLFLTLVLCQHLDGRLRPSSMRGLSPAWAVLAWVASFATTLAASAGLPVRPTAPLMTFRAFEPQGPGSGATDATGQPAIQFITFEFDEWEGQPLAATGLYQYLPELATLVGDGVQFLIFYNPRCSHCHVLFQEHFSGPLSVPVIAIEVPPAPGGVVIETDEATEIECPECQRLSLPPIHAWGITPPAVVRVRDGVVECAGEANRLTPKDCVTAAR